MTTQQDPAVTPVVQAGLDSRNPLRRLVDARLGGVPLLVPLVLVAGVVVAGIAGRIPDNMIGGLAVITGFGMLLGPLGNSLPVISKIGGGALLCLMVPSVLVYLGVVNESTLEATTALMKDANFLYFVICTLVVGSILGMNRSTMLKGLVRIFPPLVAGTVAAVTVGLAVAMAFGYTLHDAFFFLVVPIIGGGIGEGVIPLSSAYSSVLGGDSPEFVARLIPAAVIGNIVAIITAGLLRRLGDRKPHLDGGGRLVKSKTGRFDENTAEDNEFAENAARANYGVGVLTICTMFVLGFLAEPVLHLPAPVLVIIFSVVLKMANVVPPSVEHSVRAVYSIIAHHFIYPTMIGLGLLYVPLASVFGVISVGYVIACMAVVLTMASVGFFVGKLVGLYPIDASLVTLCHSGLGGTGDVAILSASDRMALMPFAQISTRVGGVATVISAASLIRVFH